MNDPRTDAIAIPKRDADALDVLAIAITNAIAKRDADAVLAIADAIAIALDAIAKRGSFLDASRK